MHLRQPLLHKCQPHLHVVHPVSTNKSMVNKRLPPTSSAKDILGRRMIGSGTRAFFCPCGKKLPLKTDEPFIGQCRRMGKTTGNHPIIDPQGYPKYAQLWKKIEENGCTEKALPVGHYDKIYKLIYIWGIYTIIY